MKISLELMFAGQNCQNWATIFDGIGKHWKFYFHASMRPTTTRFDGITNLGFPPVAGSENGRFPMWDLFGIRFFRNHRIWSLISDWNKTVKICRQMRFWASRACYSLIRRMSVRTITYSLTGTLIIKTENIRSFGTLLDAQWFICQWARRWRNM